MTRVKISTVIAAVAIAAAVVLFVTGREGTPVPAGGDEAPRQFAGRFVANPQGGFSGYGWSVQADTTTAVHQAVSAASGGMKADVTFVFYTSHHAPDKVAQMTGCAGRSVIGWSSDFGVLSPDGYHSSAKGVVGAMSLRQAGIIAGVGGASLDEAKTPADCARLALRRAIKQAGGAPQGRQPAMIVMSATYDGQEETYLETLTAETGGATPIMGGTAGGTPEHGSGDCSVFAGDRAIHNGLAIAVFYSDDPFAWAFRGGFDRTGRSGVVTASDGRVIKEIDHRPALAVYDEWSGGRVGEAIKAGKDMNTFTGLYPLCRTFSAGPITHNLFVHAWPPGNDPTTGALVTSANLWKGDVVHFAEGSWNILLNRIGRLPSQALEDKPGMRLAGGLFVCCEAVLKNIPAAERERMSGLINQALGDTPWLGMFTWGEQGNFAGVGNYHGNLLTSLTLFPASQQSKGP